MWSASGVKTIGRGDCCLLLLLYMFPRFIYVFELVGCFLSCCVLCCVSCFSQSLHVSSSVISILGLGRFLPKSSVCRLRIAGNNVVN
jgi:hypothetical protein